MKLFHVLAFSVSLLTILCAGCADEPTSVGSRLLPPGDFLKADSTILPASSSTGIRTAPLEYFEHTRILIGKNGSTESWGLLLYSFSDTLKEVTVQDAQIRMRANYHFGDSLGQFSFIVRKALRAWTSLNYNFDTLRAAGAYEPTATPNNAFGAIGDTADISFPLDTAVVSSWLRNIDDTVKTNFGIVLEPTNTAVVKGFVINSSTSIFDQLPTLEIRYTRSGSATVDTVRLTAAAERFLASVSDSSFKTDSTTIAIHNGITFRGKVDFDVNAIPAHSAVLKATLEVTFDAARSSLNSHSTDSLLAIMMTPFGFPEDTPDLRFPPFAVSELVTINGQKVYRFLVTEMVQDWVRGFSVRSIALAGITEANSIDVFALHGAGSITTAFRPRLFIIYSTPQ